MGKGKGPLIRPPANPVEESTAEREGRTHNRNVTSSKRREERTGAFVQPRMTIKEEEETEAEPEQEMDTYMDPHEDEYNPGLRFQQKYQFPVPDLPSDDDDEDGLTPAYTMAGTSGGSTPAPNPRSRPGPKKTLHIRPWKLIGETPGGPKYPHLIPSFGAHVAYDIWEGKGRHMLKLRSHAKSTWPGPNDYYSVSLLESTGLYHLRYCSLPHHNNPLIEAFIERWQPDTNSFHMPFGEMTITLHDVHYIMHLRVSGKRPNVWIDKADAIYAGARAFGVEPRDMEKWYGGGSRLDDLDRMYGDDSSFASEFQVRAYIAYLLGKLLFVDKSESKVKADFFPLLEQIDMISDYSWGSATLAYLYRQLGMATRAEAAQMGGCLTLLECWIYEYFPCFRPPMVNAHVNGEPWCKRWQVIHHIPKDEDILVDYRRRLDSMRASDVSIKFK
ncbi:PREDICTED: serine/threonine-protein phosphatase 7 long form homolog [Erythranthe guttata]|uniref:serine/threonine-protein phosphatase 7 long form homolog n=1 Tax=Erythranthe guttata TaxID=4155 RepID=UPI00064DE604|nr:PREDICTED: serine/threonine-protein phosphatase 7 long form homolog [Erythranthe guttata]|eukprot:XP_012854148.1 PREDICTED: serine/threonine-protein phosphatase 7 long form homolog [Erythranthe guttata]